MKRNALGQSLLCAMVLLVATGCPARQKVRDAAVTQRGDAPCFSIVDDELRSGESVDVALIEVSEISESGAQVSTAWSTDRAKPLEGVQLKPSSCITYGAIDGAGARRLQAGRRYSLFINADLRRGSGSENRRYKAHFCLVPEGMGALAARQVVWDEQTRTWRWDTCESEGGA